MSVSMAQAQHCTDSQLRHAAAESQDEPCQRLIGPAQLPHLGADLRAQYTSPCGLSFAYHDNKLSFVGKERDMLYTLKEDVAPPTTGRRAQFIWGTQSSCDAAVLPAEVTCSGSGTTVASAKGLSISLEALPDTMLQHIGQQLVYDVTSPDAECAAAAAAASLACTGSRAALIIAHAVWALLDPDCVKPDQHLRILQLSQGAADSFSSKLFQMSSKETKRLSRAQQKWHAAVAALCSLADPLLCPLSPEAPIFQRHRRALAAQQRLRLYNQTVESLPRECGIQESMKAWIHTGCLDGVNQGVITAAQKIMERSRRLHELQTAGSAYKGLHVSQMIDRYQQCRGYVRTGIGMAELIMLGVSHEELKADIERMYAMLEK